MSRRLVVLLALVLLLGAPGWAQSGSEVAQDSLARLTRVVEEGRPFGPQDREWLARLQARLGRESMEIPDPQHPERTLRVETALTVERLNATPGAAKALRDALTAMLAASRERRSVDLGGVTLDVHSGDLSSLLCADYTPMEFQVLFARARQAGVFDVRVDPATGLVATSGGAEIAEMAERQWVTDTVRTGELERRVDPAGWRRAVDTLSRYYTNPTEQAAFDRAIADPRTYRDGGPEEGVAHIFYPKTLQRDPSWFNNKRLESHGLALRAFVETAREGEVDDRTLRALANLAAYFRAIDYPTAPSAGNWEETPFPGGLTWDTEAIRSALADLRALLKARPEVRARLLAVRHGAWLADGPALDRLIAAGQERVRRTYLAESPGHREMDASLVFLATSTVTLDDDPARDVERFLEMLETVEKALVRRNGMIRYAPFTLTLKDGRQVKSPDSYLTLNYNVATDPTGRLNLEWKRVLDAFGSQDASDPEVFAARARLSTPDTEAEWFMVSDLSRGYARQAMKLLDARVSRPDLMERAWAGATRNLNRAYARITGVPGGVKANGLPAPSWSVPEAWQSVSTLDGGRAPLPGVNTPLTWAQVSLYEASDAYMTGLLRLEAAGIAP